MIFRMTEKVGISVRTLYEKYGEKLTFNHINATEMECGELGYFDIMAVDGYTVCMDGEECTVISFSNGSYRLKTNNAYYTFNFLLTQNEMDVAAFFLCLSNIELNLT